MEREDLNCRHVPSFFALNSSWCLEKRGLKAQACMLTMLSGFSNP